MNNTLRWRIPGQEFEDESKLTDWNKADGTLDQAVYEKLCQTEYQQDKIKLGGGNSAIIAPGGKYLAKPLKDDEGILYAELDL
jgi:aliphatic nitrilase